MAPIKYPTAFRYCFTLNNYNEEECELLWSSIRSECSYGIIGKEVGDSGTPHLQGFCIFNKRRSFQSAKDRLNPRCHLEVANGTPRQNRDYCAKGGHFDEHGSVPATSASTGRSCPESRDTIVQEYREYFKRRRLGVAEFADARPGVHGYSGHQLLRNTLAVAPPIERPGIDVEWIHGPPGSGKSRRAHERFPDAYIKDPRTKWWNGYCLEDAVIIDDFGPQGIDINHLLRWFDRYKCFVEVKGDMVPLYATKFVVTSNFTPSVVFSVVKYKHLEDVVVEDHPQLPALMRRIKLIELK